MVPRDCLPTYHLNTQLLFILPSYLFTPTSWENKQTAFLFMTFFVWG